MIVKDLETGAKVDVLSTQQAAEVIGIQKSRVLQLLWEYQESGGKSGLRGQFIPPRTWLIHRADAEAYRDMPKARGRSRSNEAARGTPHSKKRREK